MDADDPLRRLGFVVRAEARRVLADEQIAADPERTAAGWQRRFLADESRVEEVCRFYEELGYETAVDPIAALDAGEDCGDCRLIALQRLKMIYTRKVRTEDRP